MAGQQFFIDIIVYFFHRRAFGNGFPVFAAGAVALHFAVVVVAGHGQGLDPFMGYVHFHMVNDGGKILILPGVGNADPEGGVAIFVGMVFFSTS